MLANIFLVPNTETALKHTIEQISEARKDNALYPVQILMPTADSLHMVREHLGNAMGIYLYQFYAKLHLIHLSMLWGSYVSQNPFSSKHRHSDQACYCANL